jgi:hypothetical protein
MAIANGYSLSAVLIVAGLPISKQPAGEIDDFPFWYGRSKKRKQRRHGSPSSRELGNSPSDLWFI